MTPLTRGADPQRPFDAAVVIPTVLRPSLLRAVRSVFRQEGVGRIQVLIGIDRRLGDNNVLDRLADECPVHVGLTVFDPGYSTSARHGGPYPCFYGGALRTILSYAANSRHIAYLDDDDWWARDHLAALLQAIAGKDWAFSYRWFVDHDTGWPICRDEWDAVGPGRGINQERFGGFVNPSSLMLDKLECHFTLPCWSLGPFDGGTGEDRVVFDQLLKRPRWAASGRYSSYFDLRQETQREHHHAREFAARGLHWMRERDQIAQIRACHDDALKALRTGDTAAAIAACNRALRLNPHHAPLLRTLARAEERSGQPAAAIEHRRQAVETDDSAPDMFTGLTGAG